MSDLPDPLRALTEARLTTGARGRALDTRSSLAFALDHARAKEAVSSALDTAALDRALAVAGQTSRTVTSAAGDRDSFLQRPDLGRTLPGDQARALAGAGPCDVALVIGDGLSGIAANLTGAAFVTALAARLAARGLRSGPVVLAHQARVALGDGIAAVLGAGTVVVALGERPGLSSAASLGVYITHAPHPGIPDSARNCLSNIRPGGMSVDAAADAALSLILAMRRLGLGGVALGQALARGPGLPPAPGR